MRRNSVFIGVVAVLSLTACTSDEATEQYRRHMRHEMFVECMKLAPPVTEAVNQCGEQAYFMSFKLNKPKPEPQKNGPEPVGDMCQQRDDLLEPGLVDKFDAYVCIRPQE